ncbi:DUF1801 domain-containing protein [Nocardioides guangzhouensis]|uniref:DUF1801 domain-containing protein n=1 Tax=Nocardioides guangzhouensis TaxID=2497878 RepID=A0A4Q4ZJJ6_9ACTN|nr:DUF1801 domain-containing protein [Nocardioides guangzhouensis]RYP87686.1 DUF1801 domain-containing protein [Nocardioides guangzhouensis]
MQSDAATVEDYLDSLPGARREPIGTVRDVVNAHLPAGYVEQMDWGMISWVVPLADYPTTYNKLPLCYAALASQKNHMALYLMGLYTDGPEESWFRQQYAERGMRLDMGRSCVRFKHLDDLPLDVVGEVIGKIEPGELIARHEAARVGR